MRRMSFALTERQLVNGQKTVTRRLGWKTLRAGDELLAVDKCMGLKKGQKSRALARIRVVNVCREPVANATDLEARLEGFPDMRGVEFVEFFCSAMKCDPHTLVTRIAFRVEEILDGKAVQL